MQRDTNNACGGFLELSGTTKDLAYANPPMSNADIIAKIVIKSNREV